MSVKEEVLKILIENKETYLSGEEIANAIGVSRTAVWKAIKMLNDEGYKISGMNKMGYRMCKGDDVLSISGIMKFLDQNLADKIKIEIKKTITSTNTVLKQKAFDGEKEWSILIAQEQTAGRGRMNRKFYSPSDTGIYMSILLRPECPVTQALMITTMTAVAVSEALDEVFDVETKIKWVNDIYYDNKKICGILTEASVDVETSKLIYAVVGIGINVKEPKDSFPHEIKDIAGAMAELEPQNEVNDNLRNRIIAKIIQKMYDNYEDLDRHKFMKVYKDKSMLIGKDVYILSDEAKEILHVLDIDDEAGLVVKHQDGSIEHLTSGEVSVRINDERTNYANRN